MKVSFLNNFQVRLKILIRLNHTHDLRRFSFEAHERRSCMLKKFSTLRYRSVLKHTTASTLHSPVVMVHKARLSGAHFINIDFSMRLVSIDVHFVRSEKQSVVLVSSKPNVIYWPLGSERWSHALIQILFKETLWPRFTDSLGSWTSLWSEKALRF
jgi:hypothetical protein